jgi:hypothetical protein
VDQHAARQLGWSARRREAAFSWKRSHRSPERWRGELGAGRARRRRLEAKGVDWLLPRLARPCDEEPERRVLAPAPRTERRMKDAEGRCPSPNRGLANALPRG